MPRSFLGGHFTRFQQMGSWRMRKWIRAIRRDSWTNIKLWKSMWQTLQGTDFQEGMQRRLTKAASSVFEDYPSHLQLEKVKETSVRSIKKEPSVVTMFKVNTVHERSRTVQTAHNACSMQSHQVLPNSAGGDGTVVGQWNCFLLTLCNVEVGRHRSWTRQLLRKTMPYQITWTQLSTAQPTAQPKVTRADIRTTWTSRNWKNVHLGSLYFNKFTRYTVISCRY